MELHATSNPAAPAPTCGERRPRAGFALPMVIFGLVIIGTLVSGVFYSASMESRLGRGQTLQERAFQAAEYGLNGSLVRWNTFTMTALPVGGIQTYVFDSAGWFDTVRVTRLNQTAFQMVSSATVGSGQTLARHRTGMIVKLLFPTFNFQAALMTRGSAQIGGSSYINGYDTSPAGWGCTNTLSNKPGILIDQRSNVQLSGCTALRCVDGTPDIRSDATAARDTMSYFSYGDLNWNSLAAMATRSLPGGTYTQRWPVVVNGVCDTSVSSNWGDPTRATPAGACEPFFPIVYINGNATLSTGQGQGILMVEGDLSITGNFEWSGPVIVRGTFASSGTGNKVVGGVMAANVELGSSSVLGNALVDYSQCVVSQAAMAVAVPSPMIHRPWMDMFY